jgi:polar amino acid transport system substrate-binding protein
VLFSQPVLCASEAFIVREGNPNGITTYAELAASDVMFSTVAGAEEKRALEVGVPPERIMVVPDIFGAVDLLKSGRVDVIGFPDVTLIEAMKSLPEGEYDLLTGLEGEPIQCSAAAFAKENADLRDFFDAGLVSFRKAASSPRSSTAYGFDPTVTAKTDRTTLCGAEN